MSAGKYSKVVPLQAMTYCLSCISEKIFLAQLSAAWADGIDNGDDAGGAAECVVILFHVTACN